MSRHSFHIPYLMRIPLLFIFFTLLSNTPLQAQNASLLFRDSRFLQFRYRFAHHYALALEHSIYPNKLSNQYFRFYGGAAFHPTQRLTLSAEAYFGSIYRDTYQNSGAFLSAAYVFGSDRLMFKATFNPHYDTTFYYESCYGFLLQWRTSRVVSLLGQFTNTPEYRQPERRIRTGFSVSLTQPPFGTLTATPLLSIPIDGRYEQIRLHINLAYQF